MAAGLNIQAPFLENRPGNPKDFHIFEQEARKTVGEKIKGLFAVVCAQTKSMLPDSDGNKQDLGSMWIQTANTIAQMMNTDNVEKNTAVQRGAYNVNMAHFVGYTHEAKTDRVAFDGQTPVSVRMAVAPGNSQLRQLKISNPQGQLVRKIILQPHETEATWDGLHTDGSAVSAGKYRIQVVSFDENANETLQSTFVDRDIDGVGYDEKGMPYFTYGTERFHEISRWTQPKKHQFSTTL